MRDIKFQEIRDGTNIKKKSGGIKIRVEDDVINIGHILIGIDLIIRAYREFIIDNATNIAYKNITSFFDYIIREVNTSSGDTYQLTSHLFTEPERLSPRIRLASEIGESTGSTDVLSMEDTNIARKHTQTYPADGLPESIFSKDFKLYAPNPDSDSVYDLTTTIPFTFEGTIFKPLIRNVQISSRPPKELAYAAYIAARGQEAHAKGEDIRFKSKPYSGDATVMNPYYRDEAEYKKQRNENNINKKNEEEMVTKEGFNERWSDQYRALLVKYKRLSSGGTYLSGRNFRVGGHWLNRAIYPVEFSVTIDGINGFKFGDALKTQMVPKIYNTDYNMIFTVNKITHVIKENDWETTIDTYSRITTIPGDFGPEYDDSVATVPGLTVPRLERVGEQ